MRLCPHGLDGSQEASADEEERTSCCGAYCTFIEAELSCKCCYAAITGGEVIEPIVIDLRGEQ